MTTCAADSLRAKLNTRSKSAMHWLCCGHPFGNQRRREDCYKVADPEQEDVKKKDEKKEKKAEVVEEEGKFSWDKQGNMDLEKLRMHDIMETHATSSAISGMPFSIENCKDSILLVLDHTETITVDDCRDCLIILGPCAGSVFIRDCDNCTVLSACQQLRVRDCRNIAFALHCATDPVIESTEHVSFHPLQLDYGSFREDMKAAQLSCFCNTSNLHDFTPAKDGKCNFKITDEPVKLTELQLKILADHGITTESKLSLIPLKTTNKESSKTNFLYTFQYVEENEDDLLDRCQDFMKLIKLSPGLRLHETYDLRDDVCRKSKGLLPIDTGDHNRIIILEVSGDASQLTSLLTESDLDFNPVESDRRDAFSKTIESIVKN